MAPEQGPDSKSASEKNLPVANDEGSDSNNNNGRHDSIGWIYLLRKEQLVEQCRIAGIATTGFTVHHLRKKLSECLRSKQLSTSTYDLLKKLEKEVQKSENEVIMDNEVKQRYTSSVSDLDIISAVQKWGLQFSGDSDLLEFLERAEELAECYRIPCDRLLPSMLIALTENGLRWYRIKKNEICTWAEFRTEIQKFFLPKRYLAQIEDNFYSRKQHSREEAKDFIISKLTIARNHPLLRSQDHLDKIYDGLRNDYKFYIRRRDFSSLDELITLANEFESLRREENPQSSYTLEDMEYKREHTCWRCKRTGHRRTACTFPPKLFCSYCGQDGVMSRNCKCHPLPIAEKKSPPTETPHTVPNLQFLISRKKNIPTRTSRKKLGCITNPRKIRRSKICHRCNENSDQRYIIRNKPENFNTKDRRKDENKGNFAYRKRSRKRKKKTDLGEKPQTETE